MEALLDLQNCETEIKFFCMLGTYKTCDREKDFEGVESTEFPVCEIWRPEPSPRMISSGPSYG